MRRFLLSAFALVFATTVSAGAEPWKIRAVQLDLARQMETVAFLEDYIDGIAANGFNTLVLYLEGRVATKSFGFRKPGEQYTADEMRRIVAHAAERSVTVVPVVSLLGHADQFTSCPQLKGLVEKPSVFCLSRPETRRFLETYIAEMCELFPGPYFHTGFDEAWAMGTCEICAPRRAKTGMGPLFLEFVRWARDVCAAHGKRMWMWDDLWEFFPDQVAGCPKDVVMCHWYYDHVTRWGIRAHFADQRRTDWFARYRALGIEALVCCNVNLENVRDFTAYGRRYPNVVGGLVTQWEMAQRFHGIHYPIACGIGRFWTEGWDDPTFDILGAGARAAYPSLTDEERLAVATVLEEQTKGHFQGPSVRGDINLQGRIRGVGPKADALAVRILRRSALRPGAGEIAPRAMDERARLDDLVTYTELCGIRDLYRDTVPLLQSPLRTAADVAAAKRRLTEALPEIGRIEERRWTMAETWRKGMRPQQLGRDYNRKYVERLLQETPDGPAAADEWWLTADVNLPDWYGALGFRVHGRIDGKWTQIAVGTWKPKREDEDCFEAVTRFRSATAPDALRIESFGLGISGLNFISVENRDGRRIPDRIVAKSGLVRDEGNILSDDWYPAVFGKPDRFHDAFAPDGTKSHEGILELTLKKEEDR